MKINKLITISIPVAILALLVLNPVNSKSAVRTLNGDDVDASELRSVVIEGFETEPWVSTSNPADPELKVPVEVKLITGKASNLASDESNKQSMGIRFQFVYPGKNTVSLVPPKSRTVDRFLSELDDNNKPKKFTTSGIKMPGKVKAISVWVLGRGNDYTLEGWIEDWKGASYILKFGSINFVGWRPLSAKVPQGIPQDIDTYPQTKNLIFKKFVFRSTVHTNQEKVIVFMDSLKVLTDMYDVQFDGADMDFDPEDKAEKAEAKKYADQLKKYTDAKKGP